MTAEWSELDAALARISALDFAPPARFVTHAPMACEALDALGVPEVIAPWADAFERSLVPSAQAIQPSWKADEWEDALGTRRLLSEWLGYFDRALADDGWVDVVRIWVPRLMPALGAALFHGAIRTAHAVRAIGATETEPRRSELSRALANWASWYRPGQQADAGAGSDAWSDVSSFGAVTAAARAASFGANYYAAEPTIVHLHGVTGAMAVSLLSASIAPADAVAAVAQARAEHMALYAGVVALDPDASVGGWEASTVAAAVRSHDPHQVKLVEACRRGWVLTQDPVFVVAARSVTGVRVG